MVDSVLAIDPKTKHPDETLGMAADFTAYLQSGETLASSPSAVEQVTSDLTITSISINSGTVFRDDGSQVNPNCAVLFTVAGGLDLVDYRIEAKATTNKGNIRVLICPLKVDAGAE